MEIRKNIGSVTNVSSRDESDVPERELSNIVREYEFLEKSTAQLEELLGLLFQKIGPVLLKSQPESDSEVRNEPVDSDKGCDLSRGISHIKVRIQSAIHNISKVLDRIDI